MKEYVENTRIWNPEIFSGLNRIWLSRENTKSMGLQTIDDTYFLQRWKNKDNVFRFIFTPDDEIKFKDYKWDPAEECAVTIGENVFIKVTMNNKEKKMIITKDKVENMSYDLLPILAWDVPTSLKVVKLYDANAQKWIGYFKENDWDKITFIPWSKNEKNKRKLWTLSENVNTDDLLNAGLISKDRHNLNSYNLTLSDIYKAYHELMVNTWITLDSRKVIKVVNNDWTCIYRDVKQTSEWSDFLISEDKELEEKAKLCNEAIMKNLEILKTLSSTELVYKKWDDESDFYKYIWWQEWIWFHSLKGIETSEFIKQSSHDKRRLSRLFIRWEWVGSTTNAVNNSLEIWFLIKPNGRIMMDGERAFLCQPRKREWIEDQKYKITYNNEWDRSKLYFETE